MLNVAGMWHGTAYNQNPQKAHRLTEELYAGDTENRENSEVLNEKTGDLSEVKLESP